jgi:hypothetical protein
MLFNPEHAEQERNMRKPVKKLSPSDIMVQRTNTVCHEALMSWAEACQAGTITSAEFVEACANVIEKRNEVMAGLLKAHVYTGL